MIKYLLIYFSILLAFSLSFYSTLNKTYPKFAYLRLYFSALAFFTFYFVLYTRPVPQNDIKTYISYYENVSDLFYVYVLNDLDLVFYGFMYLISAIGFSPQAFIIIVYSISFFFLSKSISNIFKKNRYYFLCFLLFLSSSSFFLLYSNVIRQGLAASILLFLLSSPSKNFFLRLIMPFIHKGSLVFFFRKITNNFNKKTRLIVLVFSLFLSVFTIDAILFINSFINLPMVDFYINSFERQSSSNSTLKFTILLLTNLLFILFYNNFNNNKLEKNIYNTYFIFSVIALVFYQIDGLFSRLNFFCLFLAFPIHVFLIKYLDLKYRSFYFLSVLFFNLTYSIYVLSHPSIVENIF